MAKKKKKKKGAKGKKGSVNWHLRLVLAMLLITGIVFLPTTVVLLVGMLPTPMALLVDRTRKKVKIISVGCMNFAACTPFIIELWSLDHSFDAALSIISNPTSIIIMYGGAVIGYLIDWSMTGVVSVFLVERGKARMRAIQKEQEELVARWGVEVRADKPLDKEGFYIQDETEAAPVKSTNEDPDDTPKASPA